MCADRECCDDPDGDVATDGDATHETDDRPEEDTDIDTGEALRKALHEIEQLKQENLELKRKLTISNFGIERFSKDSKMIKFYTGFQDYLTFVTFFTWIQPAANTMKSMYHQASDTISLAGRKRNMLLIDEFFMCMCRIRVGMLEEDLADRFNCTFQTVSRKFITWINYLYFVLGSIPIWLPKSEIQRLMPNQFKVKYKSTRVLVDCTEFTCQTATSMMLNSQTYSHYKSRTTYKSLIGISPHGLMTFLSPLYTGCMSDVEIFKLSGIRDLLEPGDSVMADKGFTVDKYLSEKNVALNMPPFRGADQQFTTKQIALTQEIASLRIHVERFNRRVKENHIFDSDSQMAMIGSINQLWAVACLLANFQNPLIAQKQQ